jgi:hypothetical protein
MKPGFIRCQEGTRLLREVHDSQSQLSLCCSSSMFLSLMLRSFQFWVKQLSRTPMTPSLVQYQDRTSGCCCWEKFVEISHLTSNSFRWIVPAPTWVQQDPNCVDSSPLPLLGAVISMIDDAIIRIGSRAEHCCEVKFPSWFSLITHT